MSTSKLFNYFLLLLLSCTNVHLMIPKDALLTVPQLIAKHDYPVEEHHVTTSDGYILTLHRIPHGKTSSSMPNKTVLLMHGFLLSSADWIITGPDEALGYFLADSGYDVWMGNARGNRLSRNHTTLNPDMNASFWNFGWHEIGTIDVPTIIDYILEKTNQKQIYHIGHSQGTTTFYVMTSMRPEYNDKVRSHISLAPVAYLNHIKSPVFRGLALIANIADRVSKKIDLYELFPYSTLSAGMRNAMCKDGTYTQSLCTTLHFALNGFNRKGMNKTLLPIIMGHTPAGASMRQFLHFVQLYKTATFRQYDYGLQNKKIYGCIDPPDYNLTQITTPIYLVYSRNDWLSAVPDMFRLCKNLGSTCKDTILVPDSSFNHMDFLYGIQATKTVYKKLLTLLN